MSEPVCELMDLPKSGCAHCRGMAERRVQPTGPREPVPGRWERWTHAKFGGTCSDCRRPVGVGDRIYLVAGDWVCWECAL